MYSFIPVNEDAIDRLTGAIWSDLLGSGHCMDSLMVAEALDRISQKIRRAIAEKEQSRIEEN